MGQSLTWLRHYADQDENSQQGGTTTEDSSELEAGCSNLVVAKKQLQQQEDEEKPSGDCSLLDKSEIEADVSLEDCCEVNEGDVRLENFCDVKEAGDDEKFESLAKNLSRIEECASEVEAISNLASDILGIKFDVGAKDETTEEFEVYDFSSPISCIKFEFTADNASSESIYTIREYDDGAISSGLPSDISGVEIHADEVSRILCLLCGSHTFLTFRALQDHAMVKHPAAANLAKCLTLSNPPHIEDPDIQQQQKQQQQQPTSDEESDRDEVCRGSARGSSLFDFTNVQKPLIVSLETVSG